MMKRSVIVSICSFLLIAGFIEDTLGETFGFLDTDGSFSVIGGGAQLFGINDSGQIVGVGNRGGFLYTGGSFSTIDVPFAGVSSTQAFGINNSGQIVGDYED